ncbi:MAG: tyrosine-type recombinase/integrase [Rickettsiales bacterium]|nr:tyrosine-type recombinase/integrase [Rickettsiales bacterium]
MNKLTNINENQNFLDNFIIEEKVSEYAQHAFSKNTLLNYESDWKNFKSWCKSSNFDPMLVDHKILIIYITYLAEVKYKASTIQRKLSAILKFCEMKKIHLDLNNNEFKLVWQGIRRKLGIAKKGKEPILIKTLKIILDAIPQNTPMGIRDRAVFAFGWASAMRRSEITALNWNDLTFVDEGIIVNISQSKTDKFGEGQKIAILFGRNQNTCPVHILKKWQNINTHDPIFCSISKNGNIIGNRLSARDIARIIKKWVRHIGLDEANFAGHSLRSGLITTASKSSVPDHVIMKHTRHKTPQMIHVYTRDNSLINDNVTGMLGL